MVEPQRRTRDEVPQLGDNHEGTVELAQGANSFALECTDPTLVSSSHAANRSPRKSRFTPPIA